MKVLIEGRPENLRTVWMEDSIVCLIDQLKLPYSFEIFRSKTCSSTAKAIRDMVVRGAPAIGATAAYGMAQAASEYTGSELEGFKAHMEKAGALLKATRPTAYDLFYAVDCMLKASCDASSAAEAKELISDAAERYANDSAERCRKIGENGEKLIEDGAGVMTHCNAGALGCVDYGTALAPLRMAKQNGKNFHVFVSETRPRLQGARLTSWELLQEGVPHVLIADGASGYFMMHGEVDLIIVGADRIAANGDVVNKIGTYEKAVLAKENGIPFYVAAPKSTFDASCATGFDVKIEDRGEDEVLFAWGDSPEGGIREVRLAPKQAHARNPAFDVTPARYVTDIITEDGISKPGKTAFI